MVYPSCRPLELEAASLWLSPTGIGCWPACMPLPLTLAEAIVDAEPDAEAIVEAQGEGDALEAQSAAHKHDDVTFEPWESNNSLPTESGNYFLKEDVTLTNPYPWTVGAGKSVKLCLNGHSVAYPDTGYQVITISGTLDLYDGAGDAGVDADKSRIVRLRVEVQKNGTLNMHGGTVTGVAASYLAGGGVYVNSGGTFNMSGGTITGNSANIGGGVCVAGGYDDGSQEKNKDAATMTVSGNASVYGNTHAGKTQASNVLVL